MRSHWLSLPRRKYEASTSSVLAITVMAVWSKKTSDDFYISYIRYENAVQFSSSSFHGDNRARWTADCLFALRLFLVWFSRFQTIYWSPPCPAGRESPLVRRLDFMFGVYKRTCVCSVPLPIPSSEGPGKSNRHQVSRRDCYGIAYNVCGWPMKYDVLVRLISKVMIMRVHEVLLLPPH